MERYTVAGFAALHGKAVRTVYRWIAEGRVDARKDPGGKDWMILANPAEPCRTLPTGGRR